jgi:hypothetical protein
VYDFNGAAANESSLENPKYIIYECAKPICGGWGDRLKGKINLS